MRTRAIPDLADLPEEDFLDELSTGLELIAEHARRLDADAKHLAHAERGRGTQILRAVAEEEAAKFLILLDAARCARTGRRAHLKKYYSHLAKGLYAGCSWRWVSDFAELKEHIVRESHKLYLDGPNGDDWIARNEILQSREDALYVNYYENDGVRFWMSPEVLDENVLNYERPDAVILMEALHGSGCVKRDALAISVQHWERVELTDASDCRWLREQNHAVLVKMDLQGLLEEQPEEVYTTVVRSLTFPMCALALNEIEVDKAELRDMRGASARGW